MTEKSFMERFSLSEEQIKEIHEAERKRLAAMSPEELTAYYAAEEADAWREALSDEGQPVFSDPATPPKPYSGWGTS